MKLTLLFSIIAFSGGFVIGTENADVPAAQPAKDFIPAIVRGRMRTTVLAESRQVKIEVLYLNTTDEYSCSQNSTSCKKLLHNKVSCQVKPRLMEEHYCCKESPFLPSKRGQCASLRKLHPAAIEMGNNIKVVAIRKDKSTVNSSEPGNCTVLIFYASWSDASVNAAPNFNAIPRSFDNIRFVAFDIESHPDMTTNFFLYAVPTVLLLFNGKLFAKYDTQSFDLDSLTDFLEKYTDQIAHPVDLQPSDYLGPIPTVAIKDFEKWQLLLAWLFIFISVLYFLFAKRFPLHSRLRSL